MEGVLGTKDFISGSLVDGSDLYLPDWTGYCATNANYRIASRHTVDRHGGVSLKSVLTT